MNQPQPLGAHRQGSALNPLSLSQFGIRGKQHETLGSSVYSGPLNSTGASQGIEQGKAFAPYGEASSSLWPTQLHLSSTDSSLYDTSSLRPVHDKTLDVRETLRRLTERKPMLHGARKTALDLRSLGGGSPTVSTADTLYAVPHDSLVTGSGDLLPQSRELVSCPSGGVNCTLPPRRSPVPVPSVAAAYAGPAPVGGGLPIPSTRARVRPCLPSLAETCPPQMSSGATGVTWSEPREAPHRLRASSSSSLEVNNLASVSRPRSRRCSPARNPMGTSLSHFEASLNSSPQTVLQPSRPRTASAVLADAESSHSAYRTQNVPYKTRIGAFESTSNLSSTGRTLATTRESGSYSAVLTAGRGPPPPLTHHAHTPFSLEKEAAACRSTDASRLPQKSLQTAASGCVLERDGTFSGIQTNGARDTTAKGWDASIHSTPVASSCGVPGPRTERVNAFLGFLKDLYMDQDLIPASSVVDCLATLASYAQGLPAVQGASLPWCCVAEREIAPGSTEPICLKDRVVVKLVNTLMREQYLSCAQVSAEASDSAHASFPQAHESCGGLNADPLALVLSSGFSGSVRVSLQQSSECGEPPGSGRRSLIPLGSCSSVALALSAIETLPSHHHALVGASPPTAGFKVHLCYSSALRWLWEELCARKQHSEPFDVCTSLIACEACSSSICSEVECSSMLPSPTGLPAWLDLCNIDLAVLLLLSLASRPARHPLTSQLLERTSYLLDKCSAVGLAAWLRASAVMGLSALENPALFGRVLSAIAKQMPLMPLGTVLADMLWGLTLCGVPCGNVFIEAVPGIAGNMHMFGLEDLCFISCCYALQMRGFSGISGGCRHWSYGGHFLPPEFLRRLNGLKAYCLLGCVKMADTGQTPVIGGAPSQASESAGGVHDGGLDRQNAAGRRASAAPGEWTPQDLVRTIVDKCRSSRAHLSLKACRLLDFVERITDCPPDAAARSNGCKLNDPLGKVSLNAYKKHSEDVEEFQEARDDSGVTGLTGPSDSGADECSSSPPLLKSCLPPTNATAAGPQVDHETFWVGEKGVDQISRKKYLDYQPGPSEVTNGKQAAASEYDTQAELEEVPERKSSEGLDSSMWGDQHVPAPAALSGLHDYGTKSSTRKLPGSRHISGLLNLFQSLMFFCSSCASFAAHALFGYIVMMTAIYAISLWW